MNKQRLEAYFLSEMESIRRTVGLLEALLKTVADPPKVDHMAAIAVYLHNIYNGFENFLKRLCQFHGIKIEKTERWHQSLLAVSNERGWIDDDLKNRLVELLSLRHAFVHSYVFSLPWAHLGPLARSAVQTVELFKARLSSVSGHKWGQ